MWAYWTWIWCRKAPDFSLTPPFGGLCRSNQGWYPAERGFVNRFFRSALFPLVIIAALVWLALQTLGDHGEKSAKMTLSQVQKEINACVPDGACKFQEIVFNPNKQELKYKLKDNTKGS